MKKLISLLLLIAFIISALPMLACAETEINVAQNRPGFVFRTAVGNADYATDGDKTTAYSNEDAGRYHVDLGAAYTVNRIKLNLPSDFQNYIVYLSNTRQMSHGTADFSNIEKVMIVDASSTALARDDEGYVTIPVAGNDAVTSAEQTAKYQFVCIAHNGKFTLNEIEVYTEDAEVVNANNGLPSYWVEIAAFKPVLATTTYSEEYPIYNANDRMANTSFLTDTAVKWQNDDEQINSDKHANGVCYKDMKQRLIIDLGAEYPIRAIVFHPANHPVLSPLNTNQTNKYMGGFGIYGTNDTSLTKGDTGFDYIWGDAGNVGDYNYHKYSGATGTYRYIVVESTAKAYSDGYKYHALGIGDILIYTDTSTGVTAPDLGTETNERTHIISKGMPTYTYGGSSMPSDASALVDGDMLTPFEISGVNDIRYAFIDLGKPQTIDYITLLDCNKASSATNIDNVVYVTNELTTPRYDATRGDEILHSVSGAGTKDGVLEVHKATEAMKGKKYRYVVYAMPDDDGADKPFETVDTDKTARGYLSLLDVYTKEASFHEMHSEISIEQGESSLEYTVNATRFFSATNRNYTLLAAAYSNDNKLVGMTTKKLNLGYGTIKKLSDNIRLTSADGAAYVKVMLWDAMSHARPVVSSETFILPEFTPGKSWLSFYVSPDGSDAASGSEAAPFKTLYRAKEEVRKYNKNMQGDITVNLMPGRYELATHLELELEDSGSNGYNIIWQGTDPDNLPTVSGAKEVTGTWTEGEDGIWHVKADNLKFVREMFVNDSMAIRARSAKKIFGGEYYTEEDNYAHPHFGQNNTKYVGFYVDKSKMGLYDNPEDVEIHSIMMFRTVLLHVDDIIEDPENENQVIVKMDREFWNEYHIAGEGKGDFTPANGFIVENAYELLDEPGEFYFNKKTKILSYIPREGEDLNSAEILVPQTEQLLFVNGGNIYNRAHNIHFSNIRFAHATSFEMEESNISGSQGEYHFANNTPWYAGRAAVLLDWAENVNFEACVFYGLSTMGLHHRDGVYNCDVIGNVFADLGATAFCAGSYFHSTEIEPVKTDGPLDAAWHAPWSASYHYFPGIAYTYQALNTQRYDERSTAGGRGWYSEPWAKEEGTFPWLMVELEAEYELESLQFSFPNTASEEQRSNFEILISADRDFNEYKVLKTYTEAADFNESVDIKDGEKYRYIKFRKTEPGPFCLKGVWAWTYDRMEKGNVGIPREGTIANNYFVRAAQQKQGSYPIWLNWTNSYNVLHNTIDDAPYTGISVGWGWYTSYAPSGGNNKINYNRINDVMTYMDDGAGVYVLGKNPGTEVKENYITNSVLDGMAVYFDKGSTATADGNVSFGTNEAFNLNTTTEVALKNAYSADIDTFDAFGNKVTDPYNIVFDGQKALLDYQPIKTFSINNPPDEIVRIMAEAGIEEEWSWIEKRVPQENRPRAILYGPDASDSKQKLSVNLAANPYLKDDIAIAESMLKTGTFGPLPWHFAPESKSEMEYWLDAIERNDSRSDDYSKAAHIEEQFGLKDVIRKANDSVYHPTYEEMVLMCDEIARETSGYPAEAVTAFGEETAKIYKANPQTKADKAVAAMGLERAYEALAKQSYKTEIAAVYVENAEAVIDSENKQVTVKLPFGMGFADASPVITPSLGSEIDAERSELDFTDGSADISLYNKTSEEYTTWTVVLEKSSETGAAGKISVDAADWTGGNPNVTKSNTGNSITIEPWFQPTMNTKLMSGGLSFALKADRADTTDGISIIFSAQTTKLEATTFENKNTFYMAKLVGQMLTLYKVNAGVEASCASVSNIGFDYGSYNNMEIAIEEKSSQDRIVIKLDGVSVLDTMVNEPIGKSGYFGIITKNMAIKIK